MISQYMHFFQPNNGYTIAEEARALIYPLSLDLGLIETSHLLKNHEIFQEMVLKDLRSRFLLNPGGLISSGNRSDI